MKNYFGIALVLGFVFSGQHLEAAKMSFIGKHFKELCVISVGSGFVASLAHKKTWPTRLLSHSVGCFVGLLGCEALSHKCSIECDEPKCEQAGGFAAAAGLHIAGIYAGYLLRPLLNALAKKIIYLCVVK